MSQLCLNCGAPIYQPFDPCVECDMRPTDPSLRKGPGREQFYREREKHQFEQSVRDRKRAADGLHDDLLHEVPLLYGSGGYRDQDIALGAIHREAMLRKNGGGLPAGSSSTSKPYLPFERIVAFLAVLLVLISEFG